VGRKEGGKKTKCPQLNWEGKKYKDPEKGKKVVGGEGQVGMKRVGSYYGATEIWVDLQNYRVSSKRLIRSTRV